MGNVKIHPEGLQIIRDLEDTGWSRATVCGRIPHTNMSIHKYSDKRVNPRRDNRECTNL